ncbi:hypothetical protein ERICV_05170 (plasmid) [Paenibacillus larvae subsp. larvae]|uniref:Uncharacterized protein n=2 Tax=Paenibacillus larvae TaxID=1464 RepID=A0A6C0QZJ9_9BACL|nr:hypothetical protein ERICV_05170 [Paenibacillus larvae subsp. larvae]
MHTCSFCGSTLKPAFKFFYCDFCQMKLDADSVSEKGRRICFETDPVVTLDMARNLTTPELMTKSTFELLVMLQLIRKETRDQFDMLRVANKAARLNACFIKQSIETGNQYEFWKRKTFVVESLVHRRIGFIPEKITNSFLKEIKNKMICSNDKKMIIKKRQVS